MQVISKQKLLLASLPISLKLKRPAYSELQSFSQLLSQPECLRFKPELKAKGLAGYYTTLSILCSLIGDKDSALSIVKSMGARKMIPDPDVVASIKLTKSDLKRYHGISKRDYFLLLRHLIKSPDKERIDCLVSHFRISDIRKDPEVHLLLACATWRIPGAIQEYFATLNMSDITCCVIAMLSCRNERDLFGTSKFFAILCDILKIPFESAPNLSYFPFPEVEQFLLSSSTIYIPSTVARFFSNPCHVQTSLSTIVGQLDPAEGHSSDSSNFNLNPQPLQLSVDNTRKDRHTLRHQTLSSHNAVDIEELQTEAVRRYLADPNSVILSYTPEVMLQLFSSIAHLDTLEYCESVERFESNSGNAAFIHFMAAHAYLKEWSEVRGYFDRLSSSHGLPRAPLAILIQANHELGLHSEVLQVLEAFQPYSPKTFNFVLKSHIKLKAALSPHQILSSMFSRNILDDESYGIIISFPHCPNSSFVLKHMRELQSKGVTPCRHLYSILIYAYGSENLHHLIKETFEELVDTGARPMIFDCTLLLEAQYRGTGIKGVLGVSDNLIALCLRPRDLFAAVDATLRSGRMEEYYEREKVMIAAIVSFQSSEAGLVDYHDLSTIRTARLGNSLLKSHRNDAKSAAAVFKRMITKNMNSFKYVILAHMTCGDMNGAESYMNSMDSVGITKPAGFYRWMILGFCTHGNISGAIRMFKRAKCLKLRLDEAVYEHIIRLLYLKDDFAGVTQYFDMLESDGHKTKSSEMYNIVISANRNKGREAHYVKKLRESAIGPDVRLLGTLLDIAAKSRNIEDLYSTLNHIVQQNIEPNQHIVSILMDGLSRCGQYSLCLQVWKLVSGEGVGVLPDNFPLKIKTLELTSTMICLALDLCQYGFASNPNFEHEARKIWLRAQTDEKIEVNSNCLTSLVECLAVFGEKQAMSAMDLVFKGLDGKPSPMKVIVPDDKTILHTRMFLRKYPVLLDYFTKRLEKR